MQCRSDVRHRFGMPQLALLRQFRNCSTYTSEHTVIDRDTGRDRDLQKALFHMQGKIFACVTGEPLDLNYYASLVSDPGAGAISSFTGVTRNVFQGKTVLRLEYEAYQAMAVKKLEVSSCMHDAWSHGMHEMPSFHEIWIPCRPYGMEGV
jgi:hypothetical protein